MHREVRLALPTLEPDISEEECVVDSEATFQNFDGRETRILWAQLPLAA